MARQESWTLNVSHSEWGNYVDGINEVNRAEDWSCLGDFICGINHQMHGWKVCMA